MINPGKLRQNRKRALLALPVAAMLAVSAPAAAFAEATAPAVNNVDMPAPAPAPAPVNTAVSKSKAESLARSYVSIPDDYKLQSVNLYAQFNMNNKRNVWSLYFVKSANGKTKGSINVSINADNGDLLNFDSYVDNPNAKVTYPLKVNRDAAQEVALSFIAEISPKYKDQVRINADFGADAKPPLNGQVRHSLRFDRMVGDIPYMDNYINVDVDSEGHVLRYEVNWDGGIDFKSLKPSFTLAESAAKIRALAAPELVYGIPYRMKQPIKPILLYSLEPLAIDAVTGEAVTPQRVQVTASSPIADKPLAGKPTEGKSLTREQAVQAVKASFPVPDNAEHTDANYNEQKDEATGKVTSSWNLSWRLKDGDKETGSVYANIDSDTGMIRNFSQYKYRMSNRQQSGSRIAYSDAKAKAVELAKKQLPWLADQLFIVETPAEEVDQMVKNPDLDQYSFRFVRKAGGAKIASDNVYVEIDAYKGDVRSYWSDISALDYPAALPGVISRDQALDAWMNYYKTELTYVTETTFLFDGKPIPVDKYKLMVASGEISGDNVKTDQTVKLVYRLVARPTEEPVALDAQTGKWRNVETGDVTELVKPKATDVEGHWAQRELELMAAYHALDIVDGKLRPNQVITRGELIKMLVLAMNSGRPPVIYEAASTASFSDVKKESGYYAYIQNALEQNLIDIGDGSFNPEGKVDRGEMAELIVRALGYNALAEHDGLFNVTFKDAGKTKQKGQAAIAVGLGIMSLNNGSFQSDRNVTRAEAASAFFRYLSVRAELQEAPLRSE